MEKQKMSLSRAFFRPALFICLMVASILSGCGYSLSGLQPSILGNGDKTIKFKGVDNPTLY